MKKKLLYEVPEAEQFFVKYEENIMSPGDTGTAGNGDYGDNPLDDLGD